MKSFLNILLCLFLTHKISAQNSPTAELFVYYQNSNSNYKIGIKPVNNTTIYDKYLNPIAASDSRYNEQVLDKIEFNACYQGQGSQGEIYPPSCNGTVYYGKYEIIFWDYSTSPRSPLADPRQIDFRDANYNSGTFTSYFNKDFFVVYDNSVVVPTVYFRHSTVYKYESSYGIWDFEYPRLPDQSLFKNLKLEVTTPSFSGPVTFALGSSSYQVSAGSPLYVSGGSGNLTITTPNRIPSAGLFFTSWENGQIIDTVHTISANVNLSSVKATYKSGSYYCNTGGATYFDDADPLTFSATPYTTNPLSQQYEYYWQIKYDINGNWQQTIGGYNYTFTPTYAPGYGFYIRCYLKDYYSAIGVWSATKRVDYIGPLTVSIDGPTSVLLHSTATWTANVSGGFPSKSYQWIQNGITVGSGSSVSLTVNDVFTLRVYVTSGTQTAEDVIQVLPSTGGGGGCPFVFVNTASGFTQDNNLLHKSEFQGFAGSDLTDLYLLKETPKLDGNLYKFMIKELNQDHSYFDAFRLYAVDHPEGTRLGITEHNDIVTYYPDLAIALDDARMYEQSLADFLKYKDINAGGITGIKSDTLRLGFSSMKPEWNMLRSLQTFLIIDSIALLAGVQGIKAGGEGVTTNSNQPPKEEYAMVTADNTTISLSGRESETALILPLSKESIPENLTLVWNRDYVVKDLALTRIFYGRYVKKELALAQAQHSQNGNILKQLSSADSRYGELSAGDNIQLAFKPAGALSSGWVRDYVLETRGRYTPENVITNLGLAKKNTEAKDRGVQTQLDLGHNYPNPFNPSTTISFELSKPTVVKLVIYNTLGQTVRVLYEGTQTEGRHDILWDGRNDQGVQVPSGVYIYRLEAGDFVQSKKMTLVK